MICGQCPGGPVFYMPCTKGAARQILQQLKPSRKTFIELAVKYHGHNKEELEAEIIRQFKT